MEPAGSQEPATDFCPIPDEPNPQTRVILFGDSFIAIPHLFVVTQNYFLPSGFCTRTLHACVLMPCPSHSFESTIVIYM
jgi:hypothetical protein